jgi:hypothetical protein
MRRAAAALVIGALAAGCPYGAIESLGGGLPGPDAATEEAEADFPDADARPPPSDGGIEEEELRAPESGQTLRAACKAGSYNGTFLIVLTAMGDASAFFWGGTIGFALGDAVDPGPPATDAGAVALTGSISGATTTGGLYADIGGTYDCGSRTMHATVSNVQSGPIGGQMLEHFDLAGGVSATLDETTSPPQFSGEIHVLVGPTESLPATGTWSAQRAPSPDGG